MRFTLWLVLVVACSSSAGPPTSDPPPAVPMPAPAPPAPPVPAAVPLIDLLHQPGVTLAVSSAVDDPDISPHDLVDGDPATAWKSLSGDLEDVWIAFRVPESAHVTKIRMTAGFTATGPEGDYFTMNYRIRAVRVVRLGVVGDLGTHRLDPDSRALQDIAIGGPGGDFRIRMLDVVPGTRKTSREITVSELQVLGTVPAPEPARPSPTVAIGSLDGAAVPLRDLVGEPLVGYPSRNAYCKAFCNRTQPTVSNCRFWDEACKRQLTPSCGDPAKEPDIVHLPVGWTAARFFLSRTAHSAGPLCNLEITSSGRVYILEAVADETCGAPRDLSLGHNDPSRHQTEMAGGMLAIVMTTDTSNPVADSYREELRFCGSLPPKCTSEISIGWIGRSREQPGGDPAAAPVFHFEGGRYGWKLRGTQVELSPPSGGREVAGKGPLRARRIRMR